MSREAIIAENESLRRELDEMRNNPDRGRTSDALGDIERYKKLVREVPEYLYSIEFYKGKISATFHSPRCEEITGYAPHEYAENPYLWMQMIHENDRERVREFIEGLKEPLNCKSIEHRIVHKDGSIRWVVNMTTVHLDTKSAIIRQSGFLFDVTGRRKEQERNLEMLNENRQNSFVDDLTGLYNRRGFRELAEQQLHVASRINQPVLLFFIDVDKLKKINDTFGHHAGDELLVSLAKILKNTFRESDLIARIGGDEFTVLTMETGSDSDLLFFERLRVNIENHNKMLDGDHSISVTAGVSRYNLRTSDSITCLIDRADTDMYARKKSKSTP